MIRMCVGIFIFAVLVIAYIFFDNQAKYAHLREEDRKERIKTAYGIEVLKIEDFSLRGYGEDTNGDVPVSIAIRNIKLDDDVRICCYD